MQLIGILTRLASTWDRLMPTLALAKNISIKWGIESASFLAILEVFKEICTYM